MKKTAVFLIAVLMAMQLTACSTVQTGGSSVGESSQPTSSEVSSVISSEYPQSSSSELLPSSEPSSLPSSNVSSVVSKIDKANSSSKVSSKPASSKPTSSKPKPPASSSKPATPSSKPVSSTPPPPPESKPEPPVVQNSSEMKAVWLSFLEFQQFAGSDEYTFTAKIQSYFDTIVNKGLNTVIAQVRPHGDSFYPSQYYPWSKCISGTMGQSVSYDPLAIMVSEAHSRGLAIHAWLNPYRTMNDKEMALIDDSFPVKQWYNASNRADYMVQVGEDKRWWLKPGNTEVQNLIINGAKEIASNYKIDGIHLDDYFYGADPVKYYGDSKSEAKANTTALVKGLYDGIKSVNSSVLFGISPLGGFTAKNTSPNSDLNYLSTDLSLWCSNAGYIDYVMPQIYWEYDHKTQPFTMTLDKWQDFVTESSVKLYIGLAPYKLSSSIIENQVKDIKDSYRATGYCMFRYDHIHNLNLN